MVFFLPIHVVRFSSDQFILVGLSLCIFFLSYLYHNHSLSINLYCFGAIYLIYLSFLSYLSFRYLKISKFEPLLVPIEKFKHLISHFENFLRSHILLES